MTKGKKLRSALVASGLSLCLCVGMLAGSTYAWFTDSVTSTGNVITAGSLDVNAYYYDYDSTGTTITQENSNDSYELSTTETNVYTNDQTLSFDLTDGAQTLNGATMIDEPNIEPGWSSAKLIQIVNEGSLNAKVKLSYYAYGGLEDALWFDFVQVTYNSTENRYEATGDFTPRAMNTLADLASSVTYKLEPNAEAYFMLVYGMYTDAGNEYQNQSFNIDVAVIAAQLNVEADGFGNSDYDKDAEYPTVVYQEVASSADLTSALEEGNTAVLTSDVSLSSTDITSLNTLLSTSDGSVDAIIDVSDSGAALTLSTSGYNPVKVTSGNSLTIIGGNSDSADLVLNNTTAAAQGNICVDADSSVTLNGVNVSADGVILYPAADAAEVYIYNSTLYTTGGYCVATNASTAYNCVIDIDNSTLQVRDGYCTICVNVDVTMNISNSKIIAGHLYSEYEADTSMGTAMDSTTAGVAAQAILVRSGTVNITNSTVDLYTQKSTNETVFWYSTGNYAPYTAIVLGDATTATNYHKADASLSMTGCTVNVYDYSTGNILNGGRAIYMYGKDESGYKSTLTFDSSTSINGYIIVGQASDVSSSYSSSYPAKYDCTYVTINSGTYNAGTKYTASGKTLTEVTG